MVSFITLLGYYLQILRIYNISIYFEEYYLLDKVNNITCAKYFLENLTLRN